MQLRRLELVDFRNFEAASVAFSPGFTVLHGRNGAGKTNVLEALYMLSTLRSFRGAKLDSMLRRGCQHAEIRLEAWDPGLGVPTQLAVRIDQSARSTRRSARIDQKLIRAASDYYGRLGAVLFTPEDLAILRGSPNGRRQFLDRVLFARDRAHIADVSAYEKVLRSRNRLLKDAQGGSPARPLLETYEAGLVDYGARIWLRRLSLVRDIAPAFRAAFAQIHALDGQGSTQLECALRYHSDLDADPSRGSPDRPELAGRDARTGAAELEDKRGRLRQALLDSRSRDLARGSTSVGPHRDELEVDLDGERAIHFASQGQTRALVLAFKIAELRQSRERSGRPPLLLLDDVTSELDPRRNAQLFEALTREVGQCVLTTTAPDYIHLPKAVDRVDLPVVEGRIGG